MFGDGGACWQLTPAIASIVKVERRVLVTIANKSFFISLMLFVLVASIPSCRLELAG